MSALVKMQCNVDFFKRLTGSRIRFGVLLIGIDETLNIRTLFLLSIEKKSMLLHNDLLKIIKKAMTSDFFSVTKEKPA